jgi:hypothetical protein
MSIKGECKRGPLKHVDRAIAAIEALSTVVAKVTRIRLEELS